MSTLSTNTTSKRVVLDYTSRDYKSIRSMLVGLAKGYMPDWTTVGETGDFGTLLLELYAYAGDVMNYYIDRVASEAFLGTAVRRQSVMYIADMFGYRPMGRRAGTVPVKFTWQWDTENLPGGLVESSTNIISSAKSSSGVVTLELAAGDTIIDIVAGQTITVAGVGTAFFNGQFVVTSVLPATPSRLFTLTYKVADTTSVTATVSGSSTVTTGNVVIIPAKTALSTEPGSSGAVYSFETDFSVTLDTAAGKPVADGSTIYSVSATATATEGTTVPPVLLGTSQGIPNAEFVVSDSGVVDRTISIYSREGGQVIPWSRVDKMSLATPTQSVYTTYVDDKDFSHVLFGDNASGRIPPSGTELYVSYRYGSGVAANGLGVNTVTVLDNEYARSLGVTVSNTASPVGGADVESVESMRYSIPRSAALKQRAVTLEDYVNLALQVPGITKATAYGANYTAVYVRIASGPQSEGYLTSTVTGRYVASDGIAVLTFDADASISPGQIMYIEGVTNLSGSAKVVSVFSSTASSSIAKVSLTTNVATITTSASHGYKVGQPVTISDLTSTPGDLNGTHVITAVTATSFSFKFTHTNISEVSVSVGKSVGAPGFNFDTVAAFGSAATPVLEWTADPGTATTVDPSMQTLINSLEAYLANTKLIGSVVYGEPVEWTNADIDISVQVRPLYNRESVRAAVQTAVEDVFAYDNVDFGRRVSIGDVYRAGLAVDGVEYITVNELMVTGGTPGTVEDINSTDVDADNAYRIPRINPSLADPWVTAAGGLANT